MESTIKLLISSVELEFNTKKIVCRCTALGKTFFGNAHIDYSVILNETEDLNDNPTWTNMDLLQAISRKTNLSVDEIKFLELPQPPQ